MWNALLRALPWVLSGIGIADIATDWFGGEKPDVVTKVKTSWVPWAITTVVVLLFLNFGDVLKKRRTR